MSLAEFKLACCSLEESQGVLTRMEDIVGRRVP